MAVTFDKCIFEILGKLTVTQLSSLCNFINTKIKLLELELNKNLAYTNTLQDQFNFLDQKIRTGERIFDKITQTNPILSVAREINDQCDVSQLFQGGFEIAGFVRTAVRDVEYMSRQILTVNGIIQTAKNELTDAISQLTDICTILQLYILEKTKSVETFYRNPVQ